MSYEADIVETSLDIFNLLLSDQEVSKNKNKQYYEDYRYNLDVENFLDFFLTKLDLEICDYKDKLHIYPKAGNIVFGYTNEELRNKIPYIGNNTELYLCYFIIINFIIMFYKESNVDTLKEFVKFEELVDEVKKKFTALFQLEDLEKVSEEKAFNFEAIAKYWRSLPDAREHIKSSGKKDKISFVRRVCDFLEGENLIIFYRDRNAIYPSDRFKAIINKYFRDKDNKNTILKFIKELGEN